MATATGNPVTKSDSATNPAALRRLGAAWILLCVGLALHVTDEALTGFLDVYNPTAREIARRTGFGPPTFTFDSWLAGLVFGVCVLLALSPFAFQNSRAWRQLAYFFALIMLMNGVGHTLGTILGHSFPDITFPRPMPGFYSSPFILAGSLWLFWNLRQTRRADFRH
jgi:hypothetical protein